MEFSDLRVFLRPSIIPVLEVHAKAKRKALLEGIRFVKEVIIGNDP